MSRQRVGSNHQEGHIFIAKARDDVYEVQMSNALPHGRFSAKQ